MASAEIVRNGAVGTGARWTAVAALGYTAVWIAGLATWSSNTPLAASSDEVAAAYAGHQVAALSQSTLVHGIAAVFLTVVVLAIAGATRRADAIKEARVITASGLAAVAVSMTQWALGGLLAGWAVPSGNEGAAGALFHAINRLDGVKMAALAVMVAVGSLVAFRRHVVPGWLAVVGAVLAAALVVSAVGYLLTNAAVAMAAYVSLPLLLLWVTGAGLSLSRRVR